MQGEGWWGRAGLTMQAGLLGFYDPCVGARKSLWMRYSFRGRVHEATFADRGAVSVPLRGKATSYGPR